MSNPRTCSMNIKWKNKRSDGKQKSQDKGNDENVEKGNVEVATHTQVKKPDTSILKGKPQHEEKVYVTADEDDNVRNNHDTVNNLKAWH